MQLPVGPKDPPLDKPNTKFTSERRKVFLQLLAQVPNVRAAARGAGVTPKTVYNRRDVDPEFRDAWEAAKAISLDELEQEAFRRAMTTSDSLLKYLLQVHREDYRLNHKVDVGPVQIEVAYVDDWRPQVGTDEKADDQDGPTSEPASRPEGREAGEQEA